MQISRELDLRDIVFVGHSVSAMIGVLAATAEPDRFGALVLIGPSPRYIDDGEYVGGFGEADIEGLLDSMDSNYLGWSSTMAPVIMGNADRPELGEELTNSFCRSDPEIARQFARVTFLSDNRADLAARAHAVPRPAVLRRPDRARGRRPLRRRPPAAEPLRAARGDRALPEPQRPAGDDRRDRRSLLGRVTPDDALLEESAEDLFENAPCGYLTCALDGTILRLNRTFERLTGHDRSALLGRRFRDLLTPAGRIYHETHYVPLLQMQGAVREIALDIVRADGTPPAGARQLRPAARRRRAARFVRTTVFDATDRRAYEQELLRARRREQDIAQQLQRSLLSGVLAASARLAVEVVYRPAQAGLEVGGDWYDAFWLDDGQTTAALVVGDVVGRGIEAAAVMGQLRSAIRALASTGLAPGPLLDALDGFVGAPPRRAHDDRRARAARRRVGRAALRLRRPPAADPAGPGRGRGVPVGRALGAAGLGRAARPARRGRRLSLRPATRCCSTPTGSSSAARSRSTSASSTCSRRSPATTATTSRRCWRASWARWTTTTATTCAYSPPAARRLTGYHAAATTQGQREEPPMTAKAEFNAEEWSVVVGAPLLTAMMVVAADRGGSVRESVAVAKQYAAARERHEGELMSALLATPPAAATKRPADCASLNDEATANLREAIAILERVATEDEAVEYKRFVYSLAESVARAHKEGGFLGSAAKAVSEAEQAALDEIAAIFDEHPPPAA